MSTKRATLETASQPRVDREAGVLRGVSLATVGPAKGWGFELDQTSIEQIAALANGIKGRWSHAGALGSYLGKHQDGRVEDGHARADFHFSPLAGRVKPVGLDVDARTYLMDAAEQDPDAVALSVVIDYELETEQLAEGDTRQPRRFARITALSAADFVGEPAANAAGLFAVGPHSNQPAQEGDTMTTPTQTSGGGQTAALEEIKAKHAAELAARDAKLEALSLEVATLKQAEADRVKAERETYLAQLQAQAAELQHPLKADEVERVRAVLAAGHDETARHLGAAYLAVAKAKADRDAAGASGSSAPLIAPTAGKVAEVEQGTNALLAAAAPLLKSGKGV